jgi:hypothetical protein
MVEWLRAGNVHCAKNPFTTTAVSSWMAALAIWQHRLYWDGDQWVNSACLPVLDRPFTQFVAIGRPDFRIFERSATAQSARQCNGLFAAKSGDLDKEMAQRLTFQLPTFHVGILAVTRDRMSCLRGRMQT